MEKVKGRYKVGMRSGGRIGMNGYKKQFRSVVKYKARWPGFKSQLYYLLVVFF